MRNLKFPSLSFALCARFSRSHLSTLSTVGPQSEVENRPVGVGQSAAGYAHSLMHRHSAIFSQPSLPVPQQAQVDTHHMLVVRLCEGLVREVYGQIKQSLRLIFSHRAIVGQGGAVGHSYFPKIAITASSLFLPNGSYPNASELLGGLRK